MHPRHLALVLLLATTPFAACFCGPSKAGDACDPAASEDPCPKGTFCEEDGDGGACHIEVGASCAGDGEDEFCADGSECANDVCGGKGGSCSSDKDCDDKYTCVASGDDEVCSLRLYVAGRVVEASDEEQGIPDADVIVVDEQGTAISRVATTDADGRFEIEVPAPRDADGDPAAGFIALRASAQDHAPFPGGARQALPIAIDEATEKKDELVIENVLTTVALVELPDGEQGRASISGTIDPDARTRGGVLVVAEGDTTPSASAVSDADGGFRIFNVPAGAVSVHGYAAGLQLAPKNVTVAADDIEGVVLELLDDDTCTISGTVQIVNATGGLTTSVVLVPRSTFDETLQRGDVPRGLRAPKSGEPNVSGAFTIDGVPDGSYVVLAAFENDGLVRDPDPGIAQTQIVFLDVPGPQGERTFDIEDSFKITEALAVVSPGHDGIEDVANTSPVEFVFGNDSSEESYVVDVYDSLGVLIHEQVEPAPNGSDDVHVTYDGPALETGGIYQFRATSLDGDGDPKSRTEDLRGVFRIVDDG